MSLKIWSEDLRSVQRSVLRRSQSGKNLNTWSEDLNVGLRETQTVQSPDLKGTQLHPRVLVWEMSASPESGVQVPREPRQSTVQRSSPNPESSPESLFKGTVSTMSRSKLYHTMPRHDSFDRSKHSWCPPPMCSKHDGKLENCIFQPEDTFSAARHSQENSTQMLSSCIIDSNRPIRAEHRERIHFNQTLPKFQPHWKLQLRHPQIDSCSYRWLTDWTAPWWLVLVQVTSHPKSTLQVLFL